MNGSPTLADMPGILDAVDAAFIQRMAAAGPGSTRTVPPVRDATELEGDSTPVAVAREGETTGRMPLLEWLLMTVPEQWASLADAVEQAAGKGHRVIAVAGGRRGEGRTTIVDGLAITLEGRGWGVRKVAGTFAQTGGELPAEQRSLLLVDAGLWFPPGPIRNARLAHMSGGCDAAILVRRASEPSCSARAEALGRLGVAVLGEVETLT